MPHTDAEPQILANRAHCHASLPICSCSLCRHGYCAHYLVQQGADPFISDRSLKRSALHYAAANGRADALTRLLAEDTKIYTEDGYQSLKRARIQDVSGNCRWVGGKQLQGQHDKASSACSRVSAAAAHSTCPGACLLPVRLLGLVQLTGTAASMRSVDADRESAREGRGRGLLGKLQLLACWSWVPDAHPLCCPG